MALNKKKQTRKVEYYRLWDASGMGHGTWDTDYLDIPIDTPDDKLDEAVRLAAEKLEWRDDEPPAIVGYYCDCDSLEEEEDDDETCQSCGQEKSRDCHGRPHCPPCDGPCPHCDDQD